MDNFQIKKLILIGFSLPLFLNGTLSLCKIGSTVEARTGSGIVIDKYVESADYCSSSKKAMLNSLNCGDIIKIRDYYIKLDNKNVYKVEKGFYDLARTYDSLEACTKPGRDDSYLFLKLSRSHRNIGSSIVIDTTYSNAIMSSILLMLPLLGSIFLRNIDTWWWGFVGGLTTLVLIVVYAIIIITFTVNRMVG